MAVKRQRIVRKVYICNRAVNCNLKRYGCPHMKPHKIDESCKVGYCSLARCTCRCDEIE